MPHTKFYLIAIILVFAIAEKGSAADEQISEPRNMFTISVYYHTDERPDMPVLHYTQRRGHHGQWITDSDIYQIFIWKDGTIDWCIAPPERRRDRQWYRATIPAEKVEAALQEIVESFAKYPVKERSRGTFATLRIGANYSPRMKVYDSRHYETSGMDDDLLTFYQRNRGIFQSGDNEAILKTMKMVGGVFPQGRINPDGSYTGLPSSYMFSFRDVVEHYRARLTNIGLSAPNTRVYSDEEVLKCALLFAADAEHLLLVERKILELKPFFTLEAGKKIDTKDQRVLVEREIKDGKSVFFYSRISLEEYSAIVVRKTVEERLRY